MSNYETDSKSQLPDPKYLTKKHKKGSPAGPTFENSIFNMTNILDLKV